MINNYLQHLLKISNAGEAREESHYPALLNLFENFFKAKRITNGNITQLPKGVEGGNPDFVARRGKELLGYIEAKDFGKIDNLELVAGSD